MATTSETIVQKIAQGILFKTLSTTELAYWGKQIDQGFTTPTLLTQLAAQTPQFQNENLPLAMMYYALFGNFPTIETMMFWRGILDNGATMQDVAGRFVNSAEFYAHIPTAAQSNSAKLDALIGAMGVIGIAQEAKADALFAISKGDLKWGSVMTYLISHSPLQLSSALALLSTSLNDTLPTLEKINALGSDAPTAISKLFTELSAPITPTTNGNDIYNGSVNADSIFGLGGDDILNGKEGDDVIYGGQGNDILNGESGNDSLSGESGNDTMSGGSGTDSFIFMSTPGGNGFDTITDFTIGKSGDILNFTAFLNKANTKNNITTLAAGTAEKVWANGDILIVAGNGLTPETIAALFGVSKAFSAPAVATKAVIITADIIGDTDIWYLVNQIEVNIITAAEITKVATLIGINNLSLVGFESTNLA